MLYVLLIFVQEVIVVWQTFPSISSKASLQLFKYFFLSYPYAVFSYILVRDRPQKVGNNTRWLTLRSGTLFSNWENSSHVIRTLVSSLTCMLHMSERDHFVMNDIGNIVWTFQVSTMNIEPVARVWGSYAISITMTQHFRKGNNNLIISWWTCVK